MCFQTTRIAANTKTVDDSQPSLMSETTERDDDETTERDDATGSDNTPQQVQSCFHFRFNSVVSLFMFLCIWRRLFHFNGIKSPNRGDLIWTLMASPQHTFSQCLTTICVWKTWTDMVPKMNSNTVCEMSPQSLFFCKMCEH